MQTLGGLGLVIVWTGAISSVWNLVGNWDSVVPPSTAVALEFPASASRKTINNNLDLSGSQPLELRMTGSGYVITGNSIPSCGIDASYTSGSSSIANTILPSTCTGFEVRMATGGTLALHSDLPALDIIASGGGLMRFPSPDTSARTLTIESGIARIESSWSNTDVVLAGGALAGEGSVRTITGGSGTVSPGGAPSLITLHAFKGAVGDGAGSLTSENVSFSAGTTLEIELNGVLDDEYDTLVVNGTVSLGGATLLLTSGFVPPAEGATLTILQNDGADAIDGTFAGLAEGATLTVGGRTARISYTGGTGNDVTLEILPATPVPTLPAFAFALLALLLVAVTRRGAVVS